MKKKKKEIKIVALALASFLMLVFCIIAASPDSTLRFIDTTPANYTQEQEFTLGVLAINTHKSIYLPDETAFIGIAVLDNEGHMVCDADVTLTITDPSDNETVLSTGNGSIKVSPQCCVYGVTNLPDYYTNYTVGGAGTYVMNLTAVTADGTGTKSITDEFTVQNSVDFDVARDGPTRIYPPVPYVMSFTIKANRDYTGLIKEYVPASFVITPQEGLTVTTVGDTKVLSWDVNLNKNEKINLAYEFDAPDTSPEFYLLGHSDIGTFKELRQWMIASDSPGVPVVENYTSANSAGDLVTSLTLTKPADTEVDDLLLIIAGNDASEDTTTFNTITNWTRFIAVGDGVSDSKLAVYWKIADGTEGSTTDVTLTINDELWGWYIRISGVDTSNPINSTGTAYIGVSNSHAITQVTTGTDNCLAFYAFAFDGGDGYPFGISGEGWTETDEQQSGSGTQDASGSWGTKSVVSAGGAGIATVSSAISDGGAGIQFAIAPDITKPTITIDEPTTSSPVYRKGGEQFYVNFTYTELNPKNYTVKIYNSSATINSSSDTCYTPNSYKNVSFNLNSTAAEGWYNVSVEMYDNASNYNISYQNNSVVKVTWDSYSDPAHTTECNNFQSYESEHTVYMNGSGFAPSTAYKIIFWDNAGANREEDNKDSDTNGILNSSHPFVAGDQEGTWYATVYDDQSYNPGSHNPDDAHLVADDTFEVLDTAIPEFSTVIAAIAVCMLCAVAYVVMRRKAGRGDE